MPARKTAQTKTPAQTDTKTETTPVLDLSKLTPAVVPVTAVKHTRESKLDNSPALQWLKDSKAKGEAMSITVDTEAQSNTLINTLRQAAARLDMGVAIKAVPAGEGKTAVNFKAKDKAKRPTKAEREAKAAVVATDSK